MLARSVLVLQNADRNLVELCARSIRSVPLRHLAVGATRAANGPIYIAIAFLIAGLLDAESFPGILAGGVSLAILHSVYTPLKKLVARSRPFTVMANLEPTLPALDQHSFPSGHAMTLTAVLISLPAANYWIAAMYLCLWLLVAWSRIAVAHHYFSDVIGGSILAMVVAYPISWLAVLAFGAVSP